MAAEGRSELGESDLGENEQCKANLGKNTLKRPRLYSKFCNSFSILLLGSKHWKV